jgi:hypothetical protein
VGNSIMKVVNNFADTSGYIFKLVLVRFAAVN